MQRNSLQNLPASCSTMATSSLPTTITAARHHLRNLLILAKDLEESVSRVAARAESASAAEWEAELSAVAATRASTERHLAEASDEWVSRVRRLLARREARRERARRARDQARERRREAERRIDNDLRAARDSLLVAEQERVGAARVEAAVRDTVRRATEARRCVERLRALATLREARARSAAACGRPGNQRDAQVFTAHIERLSCMWGERVRDYERSERERRAELTRAERRVERAWTSAMFGGDQPPQRSFNTMRDFLQARCEWDLYVHPSGSTLPVGWLLPPDASTWGDATGNTIKTKHGSEVCP